MKVKDIQIDGFGVWTGLSVDSLPEGMTLFYGPNEAGKTTLMQFVRAMLYGFTPQRREKYLPPVHGGTPGGAIRVTGPGGGYHICRHSQLTDTGVGGRLTVTGQDGLSQGQHRLSMLLGQIDEPIFTNVFAIGMRELQELSTLDDTAAADELYKLSSGLDRVSLVDVLKTLRGGRRSLIGSSASDEQAASNKLAGLIATRERLRDEVQQLTRGGRRWSELASQRRVQMQEIEQLTERMAAWEREARCVEIATNVFETWSERQCIAQRIEDTQAEVHLPDDAPGQLVQIDAAIEDRKNKLEEVKRKRQSIRDQAEQLPVSRRMLELKGRIEAATEQATWVEALEEQISRLDDQIDKAQKQLEADADRLGMEDDDTYAIVEGDTSKLPDLSPQALSALSTPSRQVKESSFLLKQARAEASEHKARADKLGEELRETLSRARADNLQQAIREENQTLSTLRHRIQLGDHLDKLRRHYRELEQETVELTTSEALPIDRLILLSLPFIAGGMFVLHGVFHLLGVRWFVSEPDATWGMLCLIIGTLSLAVYYFGRESGQRSTSLDREDCERQIDSLRKQIREVEAERNDVDSTLPTSNESLEVRVRESERLLADLEASLPTYHNHQAALQSYQTARKRAEQAAESGREAKRLWSATLERLGLSDSLSPSSVRNLSDGYKALQRSRARLNELQAEREQRRRERHTIAKRIETLYLEALEVRDESSAASEEDDSHASSSQTQRSRIGPLEQLNHLHEELSRQQHWIKRRRDLKVQDQQLKRQQSAHHRAIERGEQQRRGLWAKCGVATPDQFYAMVDNKATLADLREQHQQLDQKVRSMIGSHVRYEDVETEIDGSTASDLERRWESLTTRMTETESRVAQLRTEQGQLAQEMKHLADDNRLAAVRLELGCVERKIESMSRRWQILATASCLLEDVCGTFERERQPETLREASTFLNQLTDGKYTRIWTPLGTNQLKIDDAEENSLPLDVLSRGTREAVFIALRLSLAAAYARRGVMLPLVLDDVLVNFDRDRAVHAARTLKTFAELGHQVMMFTCHDHIVDIFHDIDVEVRLMPAQGKPGRAEIMLPEEDQYEEVYEEEPEQPEEPVAAEQPEAAEPPQPTEPPPVVAAEPDPEPEPEPAPAPQPLPQVAARTRTQTKVIYVDRPVDQPPKKRAEPRPASDLKPPAVTPEIDWAWFERDPERQLEQVEDALASIDRGPWGDDETEANVIEAVPEEVWDRDPAWWNGDQRTGA